MSEWISVRNRRPPDEAASPPVLVTILVPGDPPEVACADFIAGSWYYGSRRDPLPSQWVTHWMPLPEPAPPPTDCCGLADLGIHESDCAFS